MGFVQRDPICPRVLQKLQRVSVGNDPPGPSPLGGVGPAIDAGNVFASDLGGDFNADEIKDRFCRFHVHGWIFAIIAMTVKKSLRKSR